MSVTRITTPLGVSLPFGDPSLPGQLAQLATDTQALGTWATAQIADMQARIAAVSSSVRPTGQFIYQHHSVSTTVVTAAWGALSAVLVGGGGGGGGGGRGGAGGAGGAGGETQLYISGCLVARAGGGGGGGGATTSAGGAGGGSGWGVHPHTYGGGAGNGLAGYASYGGGGGGHGGYTAFSGPFAPGAVVTLYIGGGGGGGVTYGSPTSGTAGGGGGGASEIIDYEWRGIGNGAAGGGYNSHGGAGVQGGIILWSTGLYA